PGGRWALALGEGYWRWAFRPGAPRGEYRRLWSAVAGWLLAGEATAPGEPIRPRARVLGRGESVVWLLPGVGADSLEVVLEPLGDAPGASAPGLAPPPPAADSVRTAVAGDSARTPAPPPGHYRWRTRALGAEASASGELTVERFTPELVRAVASLPAGGEGRAAGAGAGEGRPLHTFAWPWVLLVGLLCAEWVLRRRQGLR
ncbi:MAG TPA: hypothetical protein VMK65_02020, partial [Longimicrobiales bacterium]|nr:hypothetical protein [Longimicrobiales bacterium]